jgi:hypothetical protein
LVGFSGRVISPVARPLPTQNTNTVEKRTDIHASSGFRTHDLSVSESEGINALERAATVIDKTIIHIFK